MAGHGPQVAVEGDAAVAGGQVYRGELVVGIEAVGVGRAVRVGLAALLAEGVVARHSGAGRNPVLVQTGYPPARV